MLLDTNYLRKESFWLSYAWEVVSHRQNHSLDIMSHGIFRGYDASGGQTEGLEAALCTAHEEV